MQLYLIRHAQSLNNSLPEALRVEDPGLTELGHQQARYLAEWIPSLRLTRLITSPFLRALETTERIHESTSLTPEVRIALHERGGCYSGHTPENIIGRPGMSRAEIERRFPGFDVAADIGGQGWWRGMPYESQEQARQRAARLLAQTTQEFGDTEERVAYVMHADIKVLFLAHFHSEPLAAGPHNASVTTIEVTNTTAQVTDYNRIQHLPPAMVTL